MNVHTASIPPTVADEEIAGWSAYCRDVARNSNECVPSRPPLPPVAEQRAAADFNRRWRYDKYHRPQRHPHEKSAEKHSERAERRSADDSVRIAVLLEHECNQQTHDYGPAKARRPRQNGHDAAGARRVQRQRAVRTLSHGDVRRLNIFQRVRVLEDRVGLADVHVKTPTVSPPWRRRRA